MLTVSYSSTTTSSNTRNPATSEERRPPRYTDIHSTDDPLFHDVGRSDLYPVRGGDPLRGPG